MNKSIISLILCSVSFFTFGNTIDRDFINNSSSTNSLKVLDNDIKKISDEWVKIGTGSLTDFVISSIYNKPALAISAEIEQNAADPSIYRIQRPYDNWRDRRADGLVWYDETKATPMIIHVIDNKYAWFEDFNTGLYIDTADDYGPIVGEISVYPQVQSLISRYGEQYVINNFPSALCVFDEGSLTLSEYYTQGAASNPNIRLDVANEPMFRGNKNGVFCIQLPSAKDLNPEMRWNTLEGKAKFTDGFTALFAYLDEPQYPTYEVEIQQNEADPTIYRLVNPFESFVNNYSSYDIKYDNSNNYYLTIYTFPEYNVACTGTCRTGLMVDGEYFGIQNQAYYFYDTYASTFGWYLSEVAEEFSYMFGDFKDGILSYPGYYQDTYSGEIMDFPMLLGWTGPYKTATDLEQIYIVNKLGNFRVAFPGAEDQDNVDNIINDVEAPAEYYNLQGIRLTKPQKGTLVIERKGKRVEKKIL